MGSTATVDRTTGRRSNASIYIFGALGGLLFGYDLGVVAGALLSITPELKLSPLGQGLVTSSLLVGAMVGALGAGPLAERIGRRGVVLLSALVFSAGCLIASLAPGLNLIVVGRVVMGLAVGALSVTVPIYLAEISPARVRGALSGLNQLMISSGILVAYLVNLALSPSHGWRWMFGLALLPALVLLVGVYFQPESPRWLMKRGREADAARVLARNRGEAEVRSELEDIRAIVTAPRRRSLSDVLRSRPLRRVLVIGVGLSFLQQVVGINTIIYYAPTVLKSIGFADSAAILANAGLGALTVVVTVLMLLFVDRLGRRKPLIYGALGMAVCMAVLGAAFFFAGRLEGGVIGWLAIGCLALFKVSYSLSWGGMCWIVLGEIFPLRVREPAMGAATFINWLGNFLVGLFFPVLLAIGTGLVFFVFAVLALGAWAFAVALVPETGGRTLEQIERELVGAPA